MRVRRRYPASVVLLLAAWAVLQALLNRRVVDTMRDSNAVQNRELITRGLARFNVPPPDSFWVRAGVESLAFGLLLTVIAGALVSGGRRWWALLIAVVPAATVFGGFNDGYSVGAGWSQLSSPHGWLQVGTAVDTVVFGAIAVLLVRGLAGVPHAGSPRVALVRIAPIVLVLVGWWVMRVQYPEPVDRVWLARAVVFVVAAGMVASSALPLVARAVVIAGVLPLCSGPVLDGLLNNSQAGFPGMYFVRHIVVAAAVATYVGGVPVLVKRLRQQHSATPAAA